MTDTTTSPLATTLREFADTVNVGEPYELPPWIKLTRLAEAIHPRLYTVPMEWLRLHAELIADAFGQYDVTTRPHDNVWEIVAGIVDDDYTSLCEWVGLGPWTLHLMEEAVEDDLREPYATIRAGQRLALERIAYAILELCEEQANV